MGFISLGANAQAGHGGKGQPKDSSPFHLVAPPFPSVLVGIAPYPCPCEREGRRHECGGQAVLFGRTQRRNAFTSILLAPSKSYVHSQL